MRFMTETAIVQSLQRSPLGARITGLTEAEVRSPGGPASADGAVRAAPGRGGPSYVVPLPCHAPGPAHPPAPHARTEESLALAGRGLRLTLLDEGFDDAAVGCPSGCATTGPSATSSSSVRKSLWMNDELEALLRWIDLLPAPLLDERLSVRRGSSARSSLRRRRPAGPRADPEGASAAR